MSTLKILSITWLASCVALLNAEPTFSTELKTSGTTSAPPRSCEIRQQAWCIYQEGVEITDSQRISNKDPGSHTWILQNVYSPKSTLIVFEPNGCRTGFADTVQAMQYIKNIEWREKIWDQIQVRLKSDGSCDLKLLFPLYDGNPLEWAFSTGRVLLAACKDEKCTPIEPTLADVTDQYQKLFKRDGKKADKQ